MNRWTILCLLVLASTTVDVGAAETVPTPEQSKAAAILDATGVRGGFVVHLGIGDAHTTMGLRANDRYQVHGLDRDRAVVTKARKAIRAAGLYGPVAVDQWQGDRLPYIDNVANLVVADGLEDVSADEVLRVLAPGGVAYTKTGGQWKKTVKPRPDNIDDWTHFMHDAGGNAVAHDTVVGPPRHLQWLGSPRWSRHHDRMASMSALVSAGGRIFYIMDEGSRVSIQLAPKWTLVARDAFNGTVLWKRPLKDWHSHLWPLKSGPTQLARRLVAVGDRVYVTLGLKEPLSVLDAATGELVREIEGSEGTEEVLVSNGTLILLANKGESELDSFNVQLNLGDQARVAREFVWNEQPRDVMAADADTGRVLWSRESKVAPLTLAADGERLYFHDGDKVVCWNRSAGAEMWTSQPAARRAKINMNFGPKVVVVGDVVLFAGGDRTMRAYEAGTGEPLWTAPHARGGYQSPEDLLVVGGLVWSAPTTQTRDTGVWTGRELKSGEVKQEFAPNVETYWFHHRCYIAKATDRFLMPSRTGVEFVDPEQNDWDIHHWVRGGCLYGVMPCNGLVYTPPHNCACYPEAKLYGLNALAPATSTRRLPDEIVETGRLERGPAFDEIDETKANPADWPTYRGDLARRGFTTAAVPAKVASTWKTKIGNRLSSVTVANGKLFVADIDTHAVHALDATNGEKVWSYTTGGRVDSPPTYDNGRLLFGSTDGWVYCLRASDGELAWRFRAAPRDERLMAFEQLESVWPVHGSVLVEDGTCYFVAGRSNFLDGGLRFFALDAATGEKQAETIIDGRDPTTAVDLQDRLQVLNMPVGLPDVLSSDGQHIYMRSQQFDRDGKRIDLGPHSGQPSAQGSVQRGEAAHLFAPMGFLDDTWFHRSYWVYGRSFAGGHAGYYQAGKYAPSGRILVHDDDNVYGFGRKANYYKWTTTIEHQLFATSKEPPKEALSEAGNATAGRAKNAATMIQFARTESINPHDKELTVEAWVSADRPEGVIVARGGPANGYALVLRGGKPRFVVRSANELGSIAAKNTIVGRWTHVAGVLTASKGMRLYVNGKSAGWAKAPGLVAADPIQSLEIGADDGGAVGTYRSPLGFTGLIDEVRVYHTALSADEIEAHADPETRAPTTGDDLVLACSFDNGESQDLSGNDNHGTLAGARPAKGKFGGGMRFSFRQSRGGGSFVKHHWAKDVPLLVRAMVKTDNTLFIAGPPDLIDEEKTFQRLVDRDPTVAKKLAEQAAALEGEQGGLLRAVSATDGKTLAELRLDSLPVWDALVAANGRLYLATTDGSVVCFAAAEGAE